MSEIANVNNIWIEMNRTIGFLNSSLICRHSTVFGRKKLHLKEMLEILENTIISRQHRSKLACWQFIYRPRRSSRATRVLNRVLFMLAENNIKFSINYPILSFRERKKTSLRRWNHFQKITRWQSQFKFPEVKSDVFRIEWKTCSVRELLLNRWENIIT